MSSVQLLDKTRKIGKLLHNNASGKVVFNDICKVMADILASNVLVISRKGKVLGICEKMGVEPLEKLLTGKVGAFVDASFNERLLGILSTKENVNLETLGFEGKSAKGYFGLVTPIEIAGERLGSLFLYRTEGGYDIDDIILCEYGATVVGLEMLRSVSEENAEEDRKERDVKSAFGTMSGTELEAILYIFDALEGVEGILVASKIADRAGITRSVVVNALKKMESAGVIESRSAGMKGTHIKVVNEAVFDELKKVRQTLYSSSKV